ncbi:hypothetical protein ACFLUJ_06225 [Chloroflexota bacterium]
MIKKGETGYVFILTLIILAIGAIIIVPALRLVFTGNKSVGEITRHSAGLLAAESAQEYVMWDLYYGTLMSELGFDEGQNSADFTVDICGTEVDVSIIMRAVELEGGVTLATEHTILPTKTVDTGYDPSNWVPNKNTSGPFTYTITVKQESSNTTPGLDRIYDIISEDYQAGDVYETGTSEISLDGVNWVAFDDPLEEKVGNIQRLRWPNPATYGSENFISPFRDFYSGQEKHLRFQVNMGFDQDDLVVCNYVMLLVGESVLTVSDAQAPILVNNPDHSECDEGGVFSVVTESSPTVIPPLVSTNVTYTVTITNMQGSTQGVYNIISYLPPGFTYTGPTTTDMTTPANEDPHTPELVNKNGVERYRLLWDDTQLGDSGYPLGAGDNITLTFVATAEQGISGNYYTEVLVLPKNFPVPSAFAISSPALEGEYGTAYSWRTGVIIVPAYDANTETEGANITSNLSVDPDGVSVISWDVQ